MQSLKRFLNAIFPFAITLILWRLSVPVLNPCGVLAIVPIFYYSFIRPRSEFLPMAILGCFLIDYNFGSMLFWTVMFCAAFAANYLQTAFRGAVLKHHGIYSFMGFTGACLLILGLWSFSTTFAFGSLLQMIWLFVLTTAGYLVWVKTGSSR